MKIIAFLEIDEFMKYDWFKIIIKFDNVIMKFEFALHSVSIRQKKTSTDFLE